MKSVLDEFTRLAGKASYHFADDSGREWGSGYEAQKGALELWKAHPELHDDMREVMKGQLWSLRL